MSELKTEWDLSRFFEGDNDPRMKKEREEIKKNTDNFVKKWKGNKEILVDAGKLREALDDYERFYRGLGSFGNEMYYFWLKSEVDKEDPEIKARFSKIEDFSKQMENNLRFFSLDISKITHEKQKMFLADSRLKEYKHFLEILFRSAKYNLSDSEEKIISLLTTPAYDQWTKMVEEFLSKESRKVKTEKNTEESKNFSEIMSLMSHKDRAIRDSAAVAINDIFEKHVNEAEIEMNAVLSYKKIIDDLRGLERADLATIITDDLDEKIVDNLADAVSSRFDISARYYKLKARMFGLNKLKYHDRNVPYGDIDKEYTYEQGVEVVKKILGRLDKKFLQYFEKFLDGYIDVYPKKGKTSGAFCQHLLISQPTYILTNYTNKLQDILTLAHETGHGINNEFIREKQNALNFGTPISTAEIASTFMEDFVLQEIEKGADDELNLALRMMRLNDDVSTIFRQIAGHLLQQRLHKEYRAKGYLSKKDIGEIFRKSMVEYMGDAVEQSPGSENWWVYWSHLRRFFYNYQYAGGLLISKALQREVKKDPKYINKVIEFLSSGLSSSPKEIFSKIGIDLESKEFWNAGIKEIEREFDEVEKLAKKLGKI